MELPFASIKVMEACSAFCVGMAEGKTAKKVYTDILCLYGNCTTIQQVRNWWCDFFLREEWVKSTNLVFWNCSENFFIRGLERIIYRYSKCLDSQDNLCWKIINLKTNLCTDFCDDRPDIIGDIGGDYGGGDKSIILPLLNIYCTLGWKVFPKICLW